MKQKVTEIMEGMKKAITAFVEKIKGLWTGAGKKTLYWLVPVLVAVVAVVAFVARPTNNVSLEVEVGDTTKTTSQETVATAGTYTSGMLPAASSPGREFTLVLAEDGAGTFTGDYKKGEKLVVETGTWEQRDDRVTLTLTTRFGFALDVPVVHTFTITDDSLVLVDYDKSRWGSLGLTLKRSN